MNFSYPFIRRPIATTLLAIGLFLVGAVAYAFLPVASLPSVDIPTIGVIASRPGADPNTMATTVAAPLERRLGEIAGVTEITSTSSLGTTHITVQFDLSRSIDGAARDVQAALNAALSDLPGDLPTLPNFRKFNPAAAPIMILALTSKTMTGQRDLRRRRQRPRAAPVPGRRRRGGHRQRLRAAGDPRARRSDPARRHGLEHGGRAIRDHQYQFVRPDRHLRRQSQRLHRRSTINSHPGEYDPVVVKTVNGTVIRLSNVASIKAGVRNSRSAGWFNREPSVLLIITKQGNANVIDTVDRIYALLPQIKE